MRALGQAIAFFDVGDFVHTALVAAAFKFSFEPGVYNHECKAFADNTLTHGNHVGIVVVAASFGTKGVVHKGSAYARYLVGSNANADAGATNEDTAVTFAACNGFGSRFGDEWIVARIVAVGAKVYDLVAQFFVVCFDSAFEIKAAVVGT